MNTTSTVHTRSTRCHALLPDVTKRTLAALAFVVSASAQEPAVLARSANGRFEARSDAVQGIVVETIADGARRSVWSTKDASPVEGSTLLLTDDGLVLAAVKESAPASGPLVVLVREGKTIASASAQALDVEARLLPAWLESVRFRGDILDVLVADQRVRSFDLRTGAILPRVANDAWIASIGRGDGSSVALFEDSRVEIVEPSGLSRRSVLAPVDEFDAIRALTARLPASNAGSGPVELKWKSGTAQYRLSRRDDSFAEPHRELASRLRGLTLPRSFDVDNNHSFLRVRTDSAGLLSAFGHGHEMMVGRLSGSCSMGWADLSRSTLQLAIESGSLAVVDDDSQKDRAEIEKEMNSKVLEVARFPRIEFKSSAVAAKAVSPDVWDVVIEGDLALHGVTRRIRVPARLEYAAGVLRAVGDVALDQSDYKIERTSAAAGTVKVADKVRIAFDVTLGPSRGVR